MSGAAPVRPLVERLAIACVGGCTCMTKTPEIAYHDELCHYRLFTEAMRAMEASTEQKT